jgi:hypothetical protein
VNGAAPKLYPLPLRGGSNSTPNSFGVRPVVRRWLAMSKLQSRPEWQHDGDSIVVESPDGAVFIRLRAARTGLLVERRRLQAAGGARLTQTTVFNGAADFQRWCDADPLRFDYPIVSSLLRRQGLAILGGVEARGDELGRSAYR